MNPCKGDAPVPPPRGRATIAGLVLTLLLLAPSPIATLSSAAGDLPLHYKLDTFADGRSATTFEVSSCGAAGFLYLTLPFTANVSGNATVRAHGAAGSGAAGWLAVDVGADGSFETNVSFAGSTPVPVGLSPTSFALYLKASGAGSALATVPIEVSSCADTPTWSLTFDELALWYPVAGVPHTDTHIVSATVLAVACGAVRTEHFEVPEDATVTKAGLFLNLDVANTTALGATVEVRAGAAVVARNDSSEGLGWVGAGSLLDADAINAHLLNQSASQGLVGLDLVVTVCPSVGVASLRISQAFVTYIRWPAEVPIRANGSALPPLAGIAINGSTVAVIDAGAPVTLSPVANGTLGPEVHVSWFVDGTLVGRGSTLSNYTFVPGNHTVQVRAFDGTTVRAYSVQVTAASRTLPAPSSPSLLPIAAMAGVALVGIGAARTQAGRWLILGVLLGSVFARLKQASLLDHFVRGTLYQIIRENPGVHFAELRRRAKLANGAAVHHLRVMEMGGYLRVVIDGAKTRFFTTDRPLDPEVYGISDTDRAVLDAVTGTPGISQGDLARKVDRSVSVVSRSVSRLATLGFVTTSHEAGRIQVFPRLGPEAPKLVGAWPDEGA